MPFPLVTLQRPYPTHYSKEIVNRYECQAKTGAARQP